jgi:drug/metabolite transporter (DMT)-like permease
MDRVPAGERLERSTRRMCGAMPEPPMSLTQWLLLIALGILWGGSFFFMGVAIHDVPLLTLVLARVSLAALALLPVLWLSGLRLPRTLAAWQPFIGMSILNNVIPFLLIARGQKEIASGLASVLNATTPLWSVILSHLLTHDEKMRVHKVAGVLVGIFGVTILVGPELLFGRQTTVLGMLCGLGGAFAYGVSGIWGRRLKAVPPLQTATCQLLVSSVLLIPLACLVDRPWTLAMPAPHVVAAILGLAILSTALGYIIFFRILAVSGPTNAMLVTLLNPVSAIALGVTVLGETLAGRHIAGALVIAISLLLIDGRILKAMRGT